MAATAPFTNRALEDRDTFKFAFAPSYDLRFERLENPILLEIPRCPVLGDAICCRAQVVSSLFGVRYLQNSQNRLIAAGDRAMPNRVLIWLATSSACLFSAGLSLCSQSSNACWVAAVIVLGIASDALVEFVFQSLEFVFVGFFVHFGAVLRLVVRRAGHDLGVCRSWSLMPGGR